jgi:DHA1 family bicyclomycin/chloramphenicol resistance-like MFS transporter
VSARQTGGETRVAVPQAATFGFVALLICLTSLNQFAISIVLPAMPAMAAALGASGDAAKATLSVYLTAYAASMLIHGPLSDRFGRRPVLLAGMTLYSLASFGCALAPSIEVMLAWRIVQAFGAAAGVVLARAMVRDAMEGEAQTRTNAYMSTSQGISPALAPFLGGLLVEWGGWTWTFHLVGLGGVGLLIAAYLGLEETNRDKLQRIDTRSLATSYAAVLGNRLFLGITAAGALGAAPYYAYFAASPELVIARLGHSPSTYGGHMLAVVGAFMVGGMICARLAGRWSERTLLVVGAAVSALGICFFATVVPSGAPAFTAIVTAMLVYTFGLGFLFPTATTCAIRPFPEKAGTASSAYGGLFMATAALGSFAPALVSPDVMVGLPVVMAIGMALSVASLALVVLPAIRAA